MNSYGFQTPTLSKINKIMIVSMLVAILGHAICAKFFSWSPLALFGLSLNGLKSGLIFQVLTYPLMQTDLMSFLFDSLLLWFIGTELENKWGQTTYLFFLLASTLSGALLYLSMVSLFSVSALLHGPMGLTSSLCVAYALIYRDRHLSFMLFFPMKAMHFCYLIIGIQIYMAIFSYNASFALGNLGAMAGGYAYLKFKSWRAVRSYSNGKNLGTKRKNHLSLVQKDAPESDDKSKSGPKYWQ